MMRLLDLIFRRKVDRATDRYLHDLSNVAISEARRKVTRLLAIMRGEPGPKIVLGQTLWGELVEAPLEEVVKAYAIVTGGMGSGKSMFAAGIFKAGLENIVEGINAEAKE